jgi:hypothetical protein
MTEHTIDLRVNPSDETIHLGPLAVRFLITGDDSKGSVGQHRHIATIITTRRSMASTES